MAIKSIMLQREKPLGSATYKSPENNETGKICRIVKNIFLALLVTASITAIVTLILVLAGIPVAVVSGAIAAIALGCSTTSTVVASVALPLFVIIGAVSAYFLGKKQGSNKTTLQEEYQYRSNRVEDESSNPTEFTVASPAELEKPRPQKSVGELILDLVDFDESFTARPYRMRHTIEKLSATSPEDPATPSPTHVIYGLIVTTTGGKDIKIVIAYLPENPEGTRQLLNHQTKTFLPVGSRCTVGVDHAGQLTYTYTTPQA